MRITKNTPPLPKKHAAPGLRWQTGDYAKVQELRFHIPYGFLLLCKLWDITPNDMLHDFMDNLGCSGWIREGRNEARLFLQNYIMQMNYGHQHYTKEDREKMFLELDAIGMLWPANAKEKMRTLHVKWRSKYYNWWFKKWLKKYHRKPTTINNQ